MASPRRDFGAAILPSGKVLLLGGSNELQGALASVEAFVPR